MVGLLASLESYASEVTDEAAAKARGLLNQFQQVTTALGFKVAVLIFSRPGVLSGVYADIRRITYPPLFFNNTSLITSRTVE